MSTAPRVRNPAPSLTAVVRKSFSARWSSAAPKTPSKAAKNERKGFVQSALDRELIRRKYNSCWRNQGGKSDRAQMKGEEYTVYGKSSVWEEKKYTGKNLECSHHMWNRPSQRHLLYMLNSLWYTKAPIWGCVFFSVFFFLHQTGSSKSLLTRKTKTE